MFNFRRPKGPGKIVAPQKKIRKPDTRRDPRTGGMVGSQTETQPYWDIIPDTLDALDLTGPASMLLEDGTFEIGLRLRPPSRLLMSEQVLDGRHFDLRAVLKLAVPAGERARIYIQKFPARKQDLEAVATYRKAGGSNPLASMLVGKRMQLLDSRRMKGRLKRWEYFITLTVKPPLPFSKAAPPTESDLKAAVQRCISRRRDLMNRLTVAGYGVEAMNAQDIKDACFYYNTLDARGSVSAPVILDEQSRLKNIPLVDGLPDPLTIRRQVAQSPAHAEDKAYVVCGSSFVYAVSLYDLPRYTEFGLFQQVADSLTTGDLIFCIEYLHLDRQGEMERLETAQRGLYSSVNSTQYAPSASAMQRNDEVKDTLRFINDNKEEFYVAGVSVLLISATLEQQHEMLNQAVAAFSQFQASRPVMHGYQSIEVYEANSPFNGRRTEFPFKVVESNSVGFFPPIAPFGGVGQPTLVFRNSADGLTVFDPFASTTSASHFLVVGPTGWGKTYQVASTLTGLIDAYDPWITIIDRKNDFKDWMLAMGGLHIVFGGKGDTTLNPMDLPGSEKRPDEAKLNFLLTLIRNFALPGLDERLNGEEDTIIVEAAKLTYMAHSQEELPPILSDLHKILETMSQFSDGRTMTANQRELARSVAGRLRRFLGDSDWGQVLDRQSNCKTVAKYVYYDLSNIAANDEKRRKIAMHIISDRVLHTARTAPEQDKKICFIDEMTQQIKTKSDRDYISEWLRLGRAWGLSVGGAMQLPSDTQYMPELAESFNFFWLGKLAKPQHAIDNLDLPDTIADAITHMGKVDGEYADWLLVYKPEDGDPNGEVIRIEESSEFFWLQSSKPVDRRMRKAAIKRRGGDVAGALQDLAAGNYPELLDDDDVGEIKVELTQDEEINAQPSLLPGFTDNQVAVNP
ncbi:TraG P-loop domain-containing protein [Deinococcus saxicola]